MAWIWFCLFCLSTGVLLFVHRELQRAEAARDTLRQGIECHRKTIKRLDTSIDFWRLNVRALERRCRELEAERAMRDAGREAEMIMVARTTERLYTTGRMGRDD